MKIKCEQSPAARQLTQRGFTLIEMMITVVVGMVILGGLLLNFIQQSTEYKYQNKRIDVAQDLEFGIKFIEEDLRSALVGARAITITNIPGDAYTSTIDFYTWSVADSATPGGNAIAQRRYNYDPIGKSLSYDRDVLSGLSPAEILPNVTRFKVFDDSAAGRLGYTAIPAALLGTKVKGPTSLVDVVGYTILIEVEVSGSYHGQSPLVDVYGDPTKTKRVWRYTQVYPMSAL